MSAEKTHWKKLVNPNYLGAYCMPQDGKDLALTIKSVGREMVTGDGGKKEECTVCHFIEDMKPMILNRTNCKTITRLYKTPYIEDWPGKRILVYVDPTIKVAGELVEGLRIRPFEPETRKPKLERGTPAYDKVLEYMATKGAKISAVESKYELSPELMEELNNVK